MEAFKTIGVEVVHFSVGWLLLLLPSKEAAVSIVISADNVFIAYQTRFSAILTSADKSYLI